MATALQRLSWAPHLELISPSLIHVCSIVPLHLLEPLFSSPHCALTFSKDSFLLSKHLQRTSFVSGTGDKEVTAIWELTVEGESETLKEIIATQYDRKWVWEMFKKLEEPQGRPALLGESEGLERWPIHLCHCLLGDIDSSLDFYVINMQTWTKLDWIEVDWVIHTHGLSVREIGAWRQKASYTVGVGGSRGTASLP